MLPAMRIDRKALLLGSALASTLLFAAPSSASAQQAVFIPASPVPVVLTNTYSCIFPAPCAFINTITPGAFINFTNFGNFLSGGVGIGTSTLAPFAPIAVQNFGDIATAGIGSVGIAAVTAVSLQPNRRAELWRHRHHRLRERSASQPIRRLPSVRSPSSIPATLPRLASMPSASKRPLRALMRRSPSTTAATSPRWDNRPSASAPMPTAPSSSTIAATSPRPPTYLME